VNTASFRLIKNFVPQDQIESIIQETFSFKRAFYNEENLSSHSAYLSDVHPNRTSSAFATSLTYAGSLPFIDLLNVNLPGLVELHRRAMVELDLPMFTRSLFNIQEYSAASEVVPKHSDGELLEFEADAAGNLDIKRSIRPNQVAVLTLVNSTVDGGTRLYNIDGTEQVVRGEAGDLLIFDNVQNFHGVDPLNGVVKRDDGLLRLIIGWRSLNANTTYMDGDKIVPVTFEEAESIIGKWYVNEWPQQWAKIAASQKKAAF
jgi:hypothetical protein